MSGNVIPLKEVDNAVVRFIGDWEEQKEFSTRRWWEFWKAAVDIRKATQYILRCVDVLVGLVENHIDLGVDKKATVLDAVSTLYDFIVRETIPLWLKPFAGRVKDAIINVVVSEAIDFIVTKYRDGAWRDHLEEPKQEKPEEEKPEEEKPEEEEKLEEDGQS